LASGLALALAFTLKPIVWPLGLWLLVTRRYRAVGWAAGAFTAANLASWPVLGFSQISRWLKLTSVLQTRVNYHAGYALISLANNLGTGRSAANLIEIAISAGVAIVVIVLARRGATELAFHAAVALVLIATPFADSHYFTLLLVPLALTRPRLRPVWFLPLVLWLGPAQGADAWQIAATWIVAGATFGLALRRPASHVTPARPSGSLRLRVGNA
jgi:hypothetical protein